MKLAKTIFAPVVVVIGLLLITSKCKNRDETTGLTPHHIILAFDGLGNTKVDSWVWSNEKFYQQYIDYLENAGGGVFEWYNFADSIPNPISLHIKSLYTLPTVYEGESRIQPVRVLNDSIQIVNQRNKSTFWRLLEARTSNFDPGQQHKFAYVEANLLVILESLRLPQYKTYNSSLLLYSDLINNQVGQTAVAVKEDLIIQLLETNAKIALCSYTQNHATDLIQATQILSPKDFLKFVQSP